MAQKARKTEHVGPKKGGSAFYGRKGEAKRESNRRRRRDDKRAVGQERVSEPDDRGAV